MTWFTRWRRPRPNPDARMLRGVRLRLIAWSAGSTLVLLVLLGGALYAAVSQSLVSQSIQTLENRIDQMAAKLAADTSSKDQPSPAPKPSDTPAPSVPADPTSGPSSGNAQAEVQPVNVTTDASQPGLVIGGTTSGTIAFALDPDSNLPLKVVQPSLAGNPAVYDVPEPAVAYRNAARNGEKVVWEGDLRGTPARFLLEAVPTSVGPVLIESINDRTSEVLLLRTLLIVLLIGGFVALVAAVAFGYAYAGRALVPIRLSMQRQRDFAADASHELRTPLAIVRGAVEELRAGGAAGGSAAAAAARERSLSDIEAGTSRLSQLVDDLLLLARADSGAAELRREPVDLAEVATDAAAAFARQAADAGVRLRLDVEPAPVVGDPDRLCQVVGILVDNAIKHSPEGGTVTVTARPGATLTVDDEGPGVRPEDLPRLFDRFWRAADAPAGGTGLGLAIAAWIVKRHDGAITAANRGPEASGARFVVSLPGLPD